MSTTPNMAAIAASLERSLKHCSLNHRQSSSTDSTATGGAAGSPDSPPSPTLELNSQASLPFHWEQCLDLKTGEIYYINWRTGMKAKEDPRTSPDYREYYSDDEDDSSSCDSQGGSSSETSPSSSREQWSGHSNNNNDNSNQEECYYREKNEIDECINVNNNTTNTNNSNVLVVAGCKSCLMYYMVPKQLEICPKCCGHLLHFDRSIP